MSLCPTRTCWLLGRAVRTYAAMLAGAQQSGGGRRQASPAPAPEQKPARGAKVSCNEISYEP